MKDKMKENQKGFTLIEALMSVGMLTAVLVAVWMLMVMSTKVNASAGDQTQCAALAQRQMEKLKNTPWANLNKGGSIDTPMPGFYESLDPNSKGSKEYQVSWAIADTTAASSERTLSAAKIAMVTLKVKCAALRHKSSTSGKPSEVVLNTFVARGYN